VRCGGSTSAQWNALYGLGISACPTLNTSDFAEILKNPLAKEVADTVAACSSGRWVAQDCL
jgi:hypothetical protein